MPKIRLVACLALVSVVLFCAPAYAKDMAGKFGLGIDNNVTAATLGFTNVNSSSNSQNAPAAGLSFKYWINNDWAVAAVFGFMYAAGAATKEQSATALKDKSGIWGLSFDVKGIYNFAKSEMANMGAFATFSMRKESTTNTRPSGPYHSNLGMSLAVGFTPEVFITDAFALTAEFGLVFRLQNGFGVGISGDNFLGGLGFHYYF